MEKIHREMLSKIDALKETGERYYNIFPEGRYLANLYLKYHQLEFVRIKIIDSLEAIHDIGDSDIHEKNIALQVYTESFFSQFSSFRDYAYSGCSDFPCQFKLHDKITEWKKMNSIKIITFLRNRQQHFHIDFSALVQFHFQERKYNRRILLEKSTYSALIKKEKNAVEKINCFSSENNVEVKFEISCLFDSVIQDTKFLIDNIDCILQSNYSELYDQWRIAYNKSTSIYEELLRMGVNPGIRVIAYIK